MCKISHRNSKRLLRKQQIIVGDYFLAHLVVAGICVSFAFPCCSGATSYYGALGHASPRLRNVIQCYSFCARCALCTEIDFTAFTTAPSRRKSITVHHIPPCGKFCHWARIINIQHMYKLPDCVCIARTSFTSNRGQNSVCTTSCIAAACGIHTVQSTRPVPWANVKMLNGGGITEASYVEY